MPAPPSGSPLRPVKLTSCWGAQGRTPGCPEAETPFQGTFWGDSGTRRTRTGSHLWASAKQEVLRGGDKVPRTERVRQTR